MAISLSDAAKRFGMDIKTEAQDKTAPTALTPEQLEEGKKGYEKFIEDQKNNMPWYGKVENAVGDVLSSISIWAHTQMFGSVLNPWAHKEEKNKELPYAISPEKPSADWSDEERNTFGYLYTQDANEAAKYAIRIYNKYNAEVQERLNKVSETTAKETPVLGSIASVALAPTSIVGMLGTARDYALSKKYGETVKSADYVSALNHQSTRGAIANQLNASGTLSDDLWAIGGKGWGDVYSLGMGIADSLFLGAGTMTGAGMLLNRATYFSRSATEGYNDAISRGLSPDAAGLYGVIIGAIECLTESTSDKLLANVGKDQAKGLLGEALRQAGQEGVEEFVSALVDALAQEGLFGENSDRQRLIKYYMSEFNMSHEEASNRALVDLAGEIAFAGLGGALAGGVSAGSVGGLKTAWNKSSVNPLNQTATKELAPIQDKLFESGKAIEDGTSRATIDKLSQKKESGKELSGYDLRKLHSAVTEGQETDTKNNVKLAIAERLKDKGVKIEDIPALTKIILSKALGENLTKVQQIKLKNNEIATAVSNEMDATNMLSGNFDSQWAIDAGINKIRDVSGVIQTALAEANKEDVAEGSTTALNLSTEAREALRGKFTGLNSAYTPQSENTHIHTDEIKSTTLDAKQTAQIRAIERVANALGVDFYIYESEYSKKDGRKYVDKDGNVITDSGYYDPRDNSIHIDLHAGQNGEGTMLYTASHELVHWIKKSAADQFEALKDFVLGSLKKEGVQIETLIEKQINKAKENGRDMDRDGAIEEIVADACMTVLTTDAGIKAVTNLKTENKGLWNALKRFFTQFFNRIDKMYKGVKVDSEEGQYLADMHETAKKLRDLFVEGASKAAETNTSETKQTKAEQEEAFEKSYLRAKNIKSNARLTATHRAKLAAISDSASAVPMDKLLDRYDAIAKVWNEIGGELNSNFLEAWNNKEGKDRVFTIFKAQSGYKYNVELSSMCKKGIPLFEAIDTIVREEILNQLETKTLGKAEKEILYDLLKERGFDIPCAICYVEQARQREGAIIDAFLDGKIEKSKTGKVTQFKIGWNETYDALEKGMKSLGVDYKFPTADRSIATDNYKAADAVEMDAKTQDAFYSTLLALINKEIRRYNSVKDAKAKARMPLKSITPSEIKRCLSGTLGSNLKLYKTIALNPASRFRIESDLLYSSMTTTNLATAHPQLYSLFNSQGGVSTFKTKQATAIYWADILNKKWDASKLRKEGGVRNQSNSDFMMYTLLDHAQMYIDFTAKGYYLQAYTKVLAELKLFGLSRGKINASFIPKVTVYYNEDGTVDYDKTRENAGLDEKGNPIYDDIEGVNHAEAFMLLEDAEYSKSIGGICIGYSDKHIAKLLDDKRIQQIIGFHDKTDDPTKRYRGARYAKNYNGENEAQKQHSDGTLETIHIGFNQYVIAAEKLFKKDKATETFSGTAEYNGKQYKADDIPMLAADMYLEMCREKNYIPAYQQFASHPNYYKLLADFSLKDANGHYAPHKKVAYNMPDVVPYLDENGKKQYMPTRDYIKQELKKELTVRDDIAAALSDHSEEGLIPQFVKKANDLHSERKFSGRDSKSKDKQDKVTADMTEEERYEVLKNKKITAPFYDGEADAFIAEELEGKTIGFAKQAIVTIANKLGVIGSEINFKDVEVKIVLSNSNLRESLSKKATPEQIAKLLPVLSTTAENSVVIERHDNRYYYDTDTVYFDNLLGAYIDGDYLIPVRFGLKHSKMGNTTLYVVVDQNKVALENLEKEKNDQGHQDASPTKEESNNLRRSVAYSISQIIPFVNSKDLLRYIPDDMLLNENQRTAKWEAIAETIKKTNEKNDKRYAEYIEKGNLIAAKQMVLAAAKAAGYTIKVYHGTSAFGFTEIDTKKSNDRISFFATDSIQTAGTYSGTSAARNLIDTSESSLGIYQLYANTDGMVEFDAKGAESNHIALGKAENDYNNVMYGKSWYTFATAKQLAKYAKQKGYAGVIIKNVVDSATPQSRKTVSPANVYIFFDPQKQVKSADPITYDDNGNVIPLSERFNSEQSDIRYSSRKKRTVSTDSLPFVSDTAGMIVSDITEAYEATRKDKFESAVIASQIAFTNAQAGIEAIAKKYGVKNMEALVQAARVASHQAEEMIAGNQYRIGSDSKDYLGEGLQKIMQPIDEQGEDIKQAFFDYLFHQHNADRMSLERRSIEWNEEAKAELSKQTKRFASLDAEWNALKTEREKIARMRSKAAERNRLDLKLNELKREMVALNKTIRKLRKQVEEFVPLKNKAVLALNRDQIEARRAEILEQIAQLEAERKTLGRSKANASRVTEINSEIARLKEEEANLSAEVTEEQSREIIAKYEETYPDFIEVAEKIWKYNSNLNQYRVDTGLITQEAYDYMQKLYPHYVPSYRDGASTGIAAVKGKNNLAVSKTVKSATGSTKDLLNPIVIMARQTMETVRAGRINQIATTLFDAAGNDKTYLAEVSRKKVKASELVDLDPTELRPKGNQVTFYKDGKRVVMQVSSELFAGFDAFSPQMDIKNPLINGVKKVNDAFKRLVTSANPIFLLRNSIRDIQDAGINTKYPTRFLTNYARAVKMIEQNGELWNLYKAMGGSNQSYFDFDKGFKMAQTKKGFAKEIKPGENATKTQKIASGAKSLLAKMESANAYVELLPRFAEFISSIEAGNTAEQAMLDAADVTTNFARTGKVTKALNSTVIPFLNPAIQGASKAIRNVTNVKTFREGLILATKAAIVGIAPYLLNALLYHDDEEYELLRETDKENNHLIKFGDIFLKLPRGRMASVLAGLANRTVKTVSGEDADWMGYLKNASTQMNPFENMARTIFSPFLDVANNVTWYGSAIEGREFENKSPKDRYDENTSEIAIAIGKVFNYSPKKIHYLIDQYSGVIGDFLLPATTKKAEKDFFSGNLTIDPVTSNKLSDSFYDIYYEAQYAKSADANNKTAEYQVKHLNRVKSAISKLFDEKSRIQSSDLSDHEKLEQTRAIQVLINKAYKTAIDDYELITNAIEATSSVDDKYRYAEITRLVYGAGAALEVYDEKVYAQSKVMKKAGISANVFYKYYFSTADIQSDKDKNGNTISGSKRKKTIQAIDKLKLPEEKRLILIASKGYALTENERSKLVRYINGLKLSATTKNALAELCGFEVKNGKIVNK